MRELFLRLRALFFRRRMDEELQEELQFHLDMQARKNRRDEPDPVQARRQAQLQFGSVVNATEESREQRGISALEILTKDVSFGLRLLRKNPGFTAVAVLTLALGIGANTAIFSVVDWLVIRPLPVNDPGQLVYLVAQLKDGGYRNGFSNSDVEEIRKETTALFSSVAGVQPFQMDGLSVDGKSAPILTSYVTSDFFEMLGIQPALGGFILGSERKSAGADPVLVISYSCWQSRFAGDPKIVGKKVTVNGNPVTIIGVSPKGFHGALALLDTQGFLPLGMAKANLVDHGEMLLFARLKMGWTAAKVQPALEVVARRLAQENPQSRDWRSMRAAKLGAGPPSASPSNSLPLIAMIFLVLAGLVLLLACVNVANLLLIRAGARGREIAVRAALGARSGRLVRQFLTETMLLSLMGCAAGMVLGLGGSRALSSINLGSEIPIILDFDFNWRVFSFAFLAALVTGVAVGLVPALRASHGKLSDALREGGRTSTAGRQRFRTALVVAEIGGSLMLLIVAGLFARSLGKVQRTSLGFNPNHVLNLSIDPHEAGYGPARGSQFLHDLVARVKELPRVESASIAATVPLGIYSYGAALKIEGYQPPKGQETPSAGFNAVSPGYFSTMRIPLLSGRDFLDSDNAGSDPVVIINEIMAKKFWPNLDPIGQHFTTSEDSAPLRIVGVVKGSLTGSISDPVGPYYYRPFAQHYMKPATIQVRTTTATPEMAHQILGIVRSTDPAIIVFDVQTMTQALNSLNGLLLYRMGAAVATTLGILGLLLAIVGVYGVISYAASQRTHEIGIRVALGASRTQIARMILSQGVVIVAMGVVVGVLLAAATSQFLSGLLVGVPPLDPVTYAGASVLLAVIALLACYIPARRAMRVDPMVALRYE